VGFLLLFIGLGGQGGLGARNVRVLKLIFSDEEPNLPSRRPAEVSRLACAHPAYKRLVTLDRRSSAAARAPRARDKAHSAFLYLPTHPRRQTRPRQKSSAPTRVLKRLVYTRHTHTHTCTVDIGLRRGAGGFLLGGRCKVLGLLLLHCASQSGVLEALTKEWTHDG